MRTLAHRHSQRPILSILLVALLLPAGSWLTTAAAPARADEASPSQRQVAQRSTASRSSGGQASATRSSAGRSASSTRGSVSAGQGRAGGTRPGGSGGGRGVAMRRPSSGGGHGGYRPFFGGHHHYPSFHYYGYLGFGYWGYPYYGYYYPYHYYPRPVYYYAPVAPDLGALDLNVRPKRAEVYVDGYWAGQVGDFDGYPGFLWLEKGVHDLVIYHEGYATFHREVEVRPGVVIRLRERMAVGVATPPEEIVPPQEPRAQEPPAQEPAARAEAAPAEEAAPSLDLRTEPGRLRLAVEPADASVYLDGRFLGTGEELARLRSGLMLNPGEHRISVVRPAYEAEELSVEVTAGEDLDLAVRLRPSTPPA